MRRKAIASVVAGLLLPLTNGCGGGLGAGLQSGRTVVANSDSFWGIRATNTADTSTIRVAGKVIVVEPSRVLLDGEILTEIPEAARTVEVDHADDVLRISADGEHVISRRL